MSGKNSNDVTATTMANAQYKQDTVMTKIWIQEPTLTFSQALVITSINNSFSLSSQILRGKLQH